MPTPKMYILTIQPTGADVAGVEYVIKTNKTAIEGYWNYLPYVYCLVSSFDVHQLARVFDGHAQQFLLAEVNANNVDGRLQPGAWDWFKQASRSNIKFVPDRQ